MIYRFVDLPASESVHTRQAGLKIRYLKM